MRSSRVLASGFNSGVFSLRFSNYRFEHPLLSVLQSEILPPLSQSPVEDQPEVFWEEDAVKLGEGPISLARPDWYASKFETLAKWSETDLEILGGHLSGISPYMSSFDITRVAWEASRQPGLGAGEFLDSISIKITYFQGKKAHESIIRRSQIYGPEITDAVDRFRRTGHLDLAEFEKLCRATFDKHNDSRVNAVRAILVGAGGAREDYGADGSISLHETENDEARPGHPTPPTHFHLFELDLDSVELESNKTSTSPVHSKRTASRGVLAKHYRTPGSVRTWNAFEGGLEIVGNYTAPTRSKAFGTTIVRAKDFELRVPGVVSNLYLVPESRQLFIITSRALLLTQGGTIVATYDEILRSSNTYLKPDSEVIIERDPYCVRLVLADGRLLRLCKEMASIEALSLTRKLAKRVVQLSVTANADRVQEPLKISHSRADLLANVYPRIKGDFVRFSETGGKPASARDISRMSPHSLALEIGSTTGAKRLQRELFRIIDEAYVSIIGTRDKYLFAKIAAEHHLLQKSGWVIPEPIKVQPPRVVMEPGPKSRVHSYTPVSRIAQEKGGQAFLELPHDIRLYGLFDDGIPRVSIPDLSHLLEIIDEHPYGNGWRRDYVNFDTYDYSPAEVEVMLDYALLLAGLLSEPNHD